MESSFAAYVWRRKIPSFSFLPTYSFITYTPTVTVKNQKAPIDKVMIM